MNVKNINKQLIRPWFAMIAGFLLLTRNDLPASYQIQTTSERKYVPLGSVWEVLKGDENVP